MKECPHCHKDLPDDSTYCYHCGKAVDEISENKSEKKVQKLKKILVLIVGQSLES